VTRSACLVSTLAALCVRTCFATGRPRPEVGASWTELLERACSGSLRIEVVRCKADGKAVVVTGVRVYIDRLSVGKEAS